MNNPEHDTDTTEAEDCDTCCGRGWVLMFFDDFYPEECPECKGDGFVYEDNDYYYDMRENEATGN